MQGLHEAAAFLGWNADKANRSCRTWSPWIHAGGLHLLWCKEAAL